MPATTVQITVQEAMQLALEKAREFGQNLFFTDQDELNVVIRRARRDRDEKLEDYEEALSAVVELEDPENPEEGKLPATRTHLERVNADGERWGSRLNEVERLLKTSNAKALRTERDELIRKLESADRAAEKDEASIKTMEQQLVTRKQTLAMRKKAYDKANKEYQILVEMAPDMLAQAEALEEDERDRLNALKESSKDEVVDSAAVLAIYQTRIDKAKSGQRAVEIIEGDSTSKSYDDIVADEESSQASSARINRWRTGK